MAYDEHWDEDSEEDFPEPYDDHYDDHVEAAVDNAEMNQKVLDGVKAYAFSAARLSFLNRASHLISKIDDLMKETDEEEEEEEESNTDDRLNAPKVADPMALQQVRSTLRKRQEAIERGLKYAVSAQILVKPVENSHPDLVALAAGTLYHGMIRSSDLWQILAYMTVEFPTHACFSPWSILCPPQISDQNGTPYPPLPIVKAVEQFCAQAQTDSSIICDTDASDEEIPSSVHDHYYGYSTIEPRDEHDVLSKAFARLDNVMDRSEIVKLEEERDELKAKQDSLSSRMRELEDEMGGRDHSKYGSQGELYSLRDSCHSVQEGKYDYEVCIFGRAQQKDHGQKSGTGLGRWKGSTIDEETGMRKMEWTNGAKCWNGPERSATVFVTCGAENKVLTAEEPDTCRYVLEMESYIACDDDYKQRHGL
jgi:protein kinase C substrate 80K-H